MPQYSASGLESSVEFEFYFGWIAIFILVTKRRRSTQQR